MSRSDAEHPERSVEATTPEIIGKVHDMVTYDRRVKMHEIVSSVSIPIEQLHTILPKHLKM